MARITVTATGVDLSSVFWTDMTPWVSAPITTHITVPGAKGAGVTFRQGRDNAVTTLTGRVQWTAKGQQVFDVLPDVEVTVSNGIDTRKGIVTNVAVTGTGGGAWIMFNMSVTEVKP